MYLKSISILNCRFRATNPGWWYAHCHLMLHHMGGTAFAFRIGTHDEVPKPPENFPHSCGVYNHEVFDSILCTSFNIHIFKIRGESLALKSGSSLFITTMILVVLQFFKQLFV